MFFILYKFVSQWLLPPGIFIILFIVIGILLLPKKEENSKTIKKIALSVASIACGICLYLLSIYPVSNGLAHLIEKKYMPIKESEIIGVDCIVVLGSGINETSKVSFSENESENGFPKYVALARLIEAIKIYNKSVSLNGKKPKIILSGGVVFKGHKPEADIYKNFLVSMGINEKDIIVENMSRTTKENVKFSKKIIIENKFEKIILVTSASHMKRASYSFERVNLKPILAPCDFIGDHDKYDLFSFVPSFENANVVNRCLWEIVGGIVYKKIN